MLAPSPVKNMAYIKRKSKPKKERDAIESERRKCFQRDDWRCVDCGKLVMWGGEWWERGHAAHIVRASRGGKFVAENLRTKCVECHLVKEHNPKSIPSKRSLGISVPTDLIAKKRLSELEN